MASWALARQSLKCLCPQFAPDLISRPASSVTRRIRSPLRSHYVSALRCSAFVPGLCHPLYRAADGHVQIRVTFLQDKNSGRNDLDPDSAGLVTAAPRAIQIGDADPYTPDPAPIAVKSKAQAPLGVFLDEHWNICISY